MCRTDFQLVYELKKCDMYDNDKGTFAVLSTVMYRDLMLQANIFI